MIRTFSISRGFVVTANASIAGMGAVLAGEGMTLGWVVLAIGPISTFAMASLPSKTDQTPSIFNSKFVLACSGAMIFSAIVFFFAKAFG